MPQMSPMNWMLISFILLFMMNLIKILFNTQLDKQNYTSKFKMIIMKKFPW